MTVAVDVEGINHDFFMAMDADNAVRVLDDISFQIERGQFVSIVGHSGCGKSTLLRIVAGLVTPIEGQVLVDGEPISGPSATRGMVFQQDAVFPWLTVRKNIEYGLRARGVDRQTTAAAAAKWIKLVGLGGWEDAYPKELSGGMRKRVDLARVYANGPEVMLMDEPFGALDAQTKSAMQEELLKLWQNARSTVLFVTHDLEEAAFLSDVIITMSSKPGRIKLIQHNDLPRPRTEEMRLTAAFLDVKRQLYESLKGP